MNKLTEITPRLLDIIFGEDSTGDTPEERAKTSKQMWVRSQDHLSHFKPTSTGLQITSVQALEAFGIEILIEVDDYGSAIIVDDHTEPARTIINARLKKDWTQEALACKAGLNLEQIVHSENNQIRTPMNVLVAICKALGIDPVSLGFKKQKTVV